MSCLIDVNVCLLTSSLFVDSDDEAEREETVAFVLTIAADQSLICSKFVDLILYTTATSTILSHLGAIFRLESNLVYIISSSAISHDFSDLKS